MHLEALAGAFRATPHESTKLSPNMVMIGREVRLPNSVIFGHVNPAQNHFVIETKARLQRTHDLVRKQLQKSAERSRRYTMPSCISCNTRWAT
ncbi:hypothetical protein DPMN_183815 [Dreissena polymorpha]|uniref:Uncharacterized protein n=1 Tax=Dreissena polymorpha TaxID=45954 RepID=A0A9D4I5V4_DREPO|nr:hypothetical protein DPMN_183815 [Dreissena polymorpha]